MTDTLELVRSLSDSEWNLLASKLLTGPFPLARPEQRRPAGDWDVWLILAGRGWGKALSLDTPIPTPDGWAKLGEIETGDAVLDEAGRPCTVTATFDTDAAEAWRLHFSDGTHLDACADHQWVTLTAKDRKQLSRHGRPIPDAWADRPPITTRVLVDTITAGSRGDRNHCIPTTKPLHLPEAALPVDPWVLGVWLGDGSSAAAELTCHDDDADWYWSEMDRRGVSMKLARRRHADRPCGTWTLGERPPLRGDDGRWMDNGSLHSALRGLGVLHDKHVPAAYLRGSQAQRLDLLRGLMDTDGYIRPENGHAEFTSTRRVLADAVVELARSLGQKPVLAEGVASLDGRIIGPKYRVQWRPTLVVVSLPRKVAACRPMGAQAMRSTHRMIVDAEPLAPQPMRCLTVDSPHSMYLAGDGMIPTHNTRTGSEDLVEQVATHGGDWFAAGPTYADARDVMTEGPTGLLKVMDRRCIKYNWNRSLGEIVGHGWRIKVGSADEPERWRGWNFSGGWADEPGSWRRMDSWTQLRLATRIGPHPKIVVTGTPRPNRLVIDLATRDDGSVHVTRGRMIDNVANLSPAFVAEMERRYAGTRIGRQELEGELLLDTPGALWSLAQFDAPGFRATLDDVPDLVRVVTAVDPAVTSGEESDSTGIVTVGSDRDGHLWVLADDTCRLSPEGWASTAVGALDAWHGDRVVAEVNNGGDLVESVLRAVDRSVPYRKVHASRGKRVRAEPVAALYEQGRVHHVGVLAELEDQMCSWSPDSLGGSPDRVDALVWACTDLGLSGAGRGGLRSRRAA